MQSPEVGSDKKGKWQRRIAHELLHLHTAFFLFAIVTLVALISVGTFILVEVSPDQVFGLMWKPIAFLGIPLMGSWFMFKKGRYKQTILITGLTFFCILCIIAYIQAKKYLN